MAPSANHRPAKNRRLAHHAAERRRAPARVGLPPGADHVALLGRITELLAQAGPDRLTAVGVSLAGNDVELAVKPLDDGDVVAALAGFRAPPAWDAFAVVAPATARRLDDGQRRSVVVGVLAARDGFTASVVLDADDPAEDRCPSSGDGRLLDACRRVLGLPTAPPVLGPQWWAARQWVDAVLAAVLAADLHAPPDWAALHALDTGARYARRPWRALRAACAAGRARVPGVSPAAARWMDDGMFSREALSAYPPMAAMVTDLRELLPPSSFDALVRSLCERLGLTPPHGTGRAR